VLHAPDVLENLQNVQVELLFLQHIVTVAIRPGYYQACKWNFPRSLFFFVFVFVVVVVVVVETAAKIEAK
jgi:hypothetical protein